jgi:hypothetical protein
VSDRLDRILKLSALARDKNNFHVSMAAYDKVIQLVDEWIKEFPPEPNPPPEPIPWPERLGKCVRNLVRRTRYGS